MRDEQLVWKIRCLCADLVRHDSTLREPEQEEVRQAIALLMSKLPKETRNAA